MEENNYSLKRITIKDWLITFALFIIPIVNVIILLMWAFGDKQDPRYEFSRALLIVLGVVLGLAVLEGLFE